MKEVEAKFYLKDRDSFLSKLNQLNATAIDIKRTMDSYFKHPVGEQYSNSITYLRVRVEDENRVCFHRKITDFTWEEIEVVIGDVKNFIEILGRLGCTEDLSIKKKRHTYDYCNALICVDTVEGLGEFVEVEAKDEVHLAEICSKLGLDINGKDCLPGISYVKLMRDKQPKTRQAKVASHRSH